MKLERVVLKNFRGYRDETQIEISDLTALIGRNDAGKSTVLEALEIFFNNSLVVCEREDLSINSTSQNIEISCEFSDIPAGVVIDAANPTDLGEEHLLNRDGLLRIKKIFSATAAKPKPKVYFCCEHPTVEGASDLLELKRTDLRARANQLGIDPQEYNGNVNASIRQAVRRHFEDLQLGAVELLVDKEDTKKVYETIREYLPVFALFQSDRTSRDDDKEVVDPMTLAVKQALQDLEAELDHIKAEVRRKAVETAERTLLKLQEMAPELASELTPEFRTEPNFATQFKLAIKSEDDISLNKRGSGVRRLILLNFFRAEAERRLNEQVTNHIIYAFEEPETSQHPDHQEVLINAFLQLAQSPTCQILLTTHTPALAGLLPLDSLRFIEKSGPSRTVGMGTEAVFEQVVDTLGVLPHPIPKDSVAALLVEGKGDLVFIKHTAEKLKEGGHIPATLEERRIALIPIGGCGNIKHWQAQRLVAQFGIPYFVLLDSDAGTIEHAKNLTALANLHADGICAYLTKKREPENYINPDCLGLAAGETLVIGDTDDAKALISQKMGSRKTTVIEDYWVRMNAAQVREAEKYLDAGQERFEFTEMFNDFFGRV